MEQMVDIADKHIIDLLRGRDGAVTFVRMKTGDTYKVLNIAWGYDMEDSHAHVTTNISPALPDAPSDFFFTNEIESIEGMNGQILPTKPTYAVLNGDNFSNVDEFFDWVQRSATRRLDWHIGENLNAFNDVLRGGFGLHEYEELLWLVWLESNKSRQHLGDVLFGDIVGIIKGHSHVELELQ